MNLTNIEINNVLGIKNANIALSKQALLIAGANGAGKSSIAEAVRQALIAQAERVTLKKDFGKLLHGQADSGHAIVTTSLGDYGVLLPDGKQTGDTAALPFALAYCLDPAKFALADADQRRTFLLKLMGVKITPDAITEKLVQRDIPWPIIQQIKPHLASGFEAAHKEAQSLGRDNKAAWRAVTGETYGAVKADSWAAQKDLSADPALYASANEKVANADAHIEKISATIGELTAKLNNADAVNAALNKRSAKIEALREEAAKFARVQDKLNRDTKELDAWNSKLKAIDEAVTSQDACGCPACGVMLVNVAGKLVEAGPMAHGTEDDIGKKPEYTKARDLMQSAVNNGKRDLQIAENAARELAALESEPADLVIDCDNLRAELAAAKNLLSGAKANRDIDRKDAETISKIMAANDAAEQKTKTAAEHHANVKAYEMCADALAPSGIPSELLSEAISPFNKAMASLSALAEWPVVSIDSDMAIFADDKEYKLRSESERWRADAVIALAIAKISQAKIVILDRFDVLDLKGRGDAFYLIENLPKDINIILLGTLKAIPAQLPACMQAIWVADGIANSKQEEAA